VNEEGRSGAEDDRGAVSAFAIDAATGGLTFLNQQASGGAAPCHLSIDKTGHHVLVANYGGGSVAVLPIQQDGRLGAATALVRHQGSSVNKERQQGPHAHAIDVDAANRHVLAADLGLDKLLVYRFDPSKGTLTPEETKAGKTSPGAGPRHFAFHPSGRFVYVINELDSTVTVFGYGAEQASLTAIQSVPTLPSGFTGTSATAEVVLSPDGRFLYGSNRGHDSLAIFAIDSGDGKLTAVGHEPTRGKKPRNFAIDPTGAYLLAANQDSDSIAVFRIDPATGRLSAVGDPVHAPRPVCITFARPAR
jgi:6-phosphogluconolactonase